MKLLAVLVLGVPASCFYERSAPHAVMPNPKGQSLAFMVAGVGPIRHTPTKRTLQMSVKAADESGVLSFFDTKTRSRVVLVGTMHYNPTSIALATRTVRNEAESSTGEAECACCVLLAA